MAVPRRPGSPQAVLAVGVAITAVLPAGFSCWMFHRRPSTPRLPSCLPRDLVARIVGDPMVRPFIVDDPLAGYLPITERLLPAGGLDIATVSDAELLVLLFAPVDPMRQLGMLTAVTILLALVITPRSAPESRRGDQGLGGPLKACGESRR